MYDDLKENIILLMQHPIARRPISNLSDEEREKAFDLLNYLSTLSVDENYTLLDYIQMARLEYALGELEYKTTNDTEKVIQMLANIQSDISTIHSNMDRMQT